MNAWTGALVRFAVAVLARTWRWEIRGDEHVARACAGGRRLIYAPWHGTLVPLVWWHRHQDIAMLVSRHADGALLADTARRWGYRVTRGSSTRGGIAGLRGVLRALRKGGAVGLAPDGPRGPAGVAKPGIIAAARWTGALVVPVAAHAAGWRLRSWDRMLIPYPFATIRVVYGAPLEVTPERAPESARRELEDALHRLTREIAA